MKSKDELWREIDALNYDIGGYKQRLNLVLNDIENICTLPSSGDKVIHLDCSQILNIIYNRFPELRQQNETKFD